MDTGTVTIEVAPTGEPQPSDFTNQFIGDAGPNPFQGTNVDDWIDGKDGRDNINGKDGDDYIIAGPGNDWIRAWWQWRRHLPVRDWRRRHQASLTGRTASTKSAW